MLQIPKSKILWLKSIGKDTLWGWQGLQAAGLAGRGTSVPLALWIYSLQQSL